MLFMGSGNQLMLVSNLIGDRGENAVQMCFVRALAQHNGFEPHFLGPKAQLLDFHVSLLDSAGKAFGPHFFVQVKTKKKPSVDKKFIAGFGSNEVFRAKAGWVPVYVAGVEVISDTSEKVWVCGLGSQPTLNSIPKAHNLKSPTTLIKLYGEVLDHFNAHTYAFSTKLI